MDRRAIFFACAMLACLLLTPLADEKLRWVPLTLAAVYLVLAVLSLLDSWSRHRHRINRTDR